MPLVSKSVVVEAAQVGRIDRVVQGLAGCSRSQVRGLFDHRCVRWNDAVCLDPGQLVAVGDHVSLRFDPQQRYRPQKIWRDATFSIVFEDRELLVVDKAAHVLTVPTARGEPNTLVDRVASYVRQQGTGRDVLVVHRLDRGVSGLLVFAKTPAAASRLHEQFRAHQPERTYLALVAGHLPAAVGTFRSHLATAKNLDRYSTPHAAQGELAITHYRVLRQVAGADFVEIRLETGRRNQIRVHFAEAGHPVLGDRRYGRDSGGPTVWTAKRLALHAASLGFIHPTSGNRLEFSSPLPAEMAKLANK